MAIEPTEPTAPDEGATRLLALAGSADHHAHARSLAMAADAVSATDARLDDRQRAAFNALFEALIGGAARRLRPAGPATRAPDDAAIVRRVLTSGLARDADFMTELVEQARLDTLASLLNAVADDDPDRPSLLARLTEHADPELAAAALAMLVADNRRRGGHDDLHIDLPRGHYRKLMWWVAAASRTSRAGQDDTDAVDRALIAAVRHALDAHDDTLRQDAVASRLAQALAPDDRELPDLLIDALADRRAALFVALLAQALDAPFAALRTVVLEPTGERLWLVLRALDLPRAAIAQIGVMLAEAEPRRDLERLADELDHIMAVTPERARIAVAPLHLPLAYRAALDDLRGRA